MRYKKHFKNCSVTTLLSAPGSRLHSLLAHADRFKQTEQLIKMAMPSSAREHCRLISYYKGTLKLQASSAAWATRLRYQQQTIISQLASSKDFSGICKIAISVSPVSTKNKISHQVQPISASSLANMKDTALHMGDSPIAAALKHLATNKPS